MYVGTCVEILIESGKKIPIYVVWFPLSYVGVRQLAWIMVFWLLFPGLDSGVR